MAKIDSVYDFTPKGLVEMKSWLEPWFLTRCPCAAAAAPGTEPFFNAMMTLAATNDLRGYWRLGDGGHGPYADSKPASSWVNTPMARVTGATAMTDIDPGALPAGQDDGAVQFNSSTGAGDYLQAPNVWGTITSNPFDMDMGTVAAWVKPSASSSTFDSGIFSMLATTVTTPQGYVVGVAWPSRTVFHQRGTTRLTGPVLAAGTWVFVVGVKDATSTRIYLNGALVATGASVSGTPGTNIEPMIGLFNQSLGTGIFYGAIDEVSVWGNALDDTEIATLVASVGLATAPTVRSVISTIAAYTANLGETVFANGTFTVTLPAAAGNLGGEVTVKNTGAGTITVDGAGSETIDGSLTKTLAANAACTVVSDSANWQLIGAYP